MQGRETMERSADRPVQGRETVEESVAEAAEESVDETTESDEPESGAEEEPAAERYVAPNLAPRDGRRTRRDLNAQRRDEKMQQEFAKKPYRSRGGKGQ